MMSDPTPHLDFDFLVDRYEKPIYSLILRMMGDCDEAADLTQDTFVAAFRSRESFRGEASVYTWIYRIAVNKCRNAAARRGRRREHELETDDIEAAAAPSEGPHAIVERKELRDLIEQAISQLPFDYRIVVVLRDLQGLSYAEVAEAAELSVDVVRTRLARARGMLRRRLGPYLDAA